MKEDIYSSIDPHQYAYKKNRSNADAVSTIVHLALTHNESKDTYVRLLFLDFNATFNTNHPTDTNT